jgi:hypothetical protein
MTNTPRIPEWVQFVLDHGFLAAASDMAHILGQSISDIHHIQSMGACAKRKSRGRFAQLFLLWHGREPQDHEWPAPTKLGGRKSYEWLGPELALLASLVGTVDKREIARALTLRLRQSTGDETASRTPTAVQVAINRIGMMVKDVVGGITTADAGREIGSLSIINQAIHKREIHAMRVGRMWVIPHAC